MWPPSAWRTLHKPRGAWELYLALTSLCLSIQIIHCSPPIDFFIYTAGQGGPASLSPAAPPREANSNQPAASVLQNLESIYELDLPTGGQEDGRQQLARRVLALVQNSSHQHDNNLVDLDATRLAWHLMEKQLLVYMKNRLDSSMPFIRAVLAESNVTSACGGAIEGWLQSLGRLESWAAVMWNAWGEFPPSGFFEGSFTDLGSYRGCMSIPDSPLIGQPQYCTLDFQPLVPTRPRFHSIFKKILDIDASSGQISTGDFSADSLNSHSSAHGFKSTIFDTPADTISESSSSEPLYTKYYKRTVSQNGTSETTTSAPNLQLDAQPPASNLTIKSEALIELIRKAQYFYYVKFRLGACLPSKCSQEDVQKLAQTASKRAVLQANPVSCMKKEPTQVNGYQRFAIWALSSLALIALIGTALDLLNLKDDNKSSLVGWLLLFSIWTNSKRLFDLNPSDSHTDLGCIHGLRFFSMIWVIYGHTILYTEYQAFTHFFQMIETQIPSFIMLPSLNANFSVDTFFVISGILTTYVTWEVTQGDSRKFNKFAFIIARYIRLTPQLAIVILCFFLLPLFGEGPLYKQVTDDKADLCYNNWAINLLYLQSYIKSEKLCIDPSWWLSIEMTFHMVSLIVIVVMIKNPVKGMWVNLLVASVLTFWGAIIHYSHGFAIQYLPSIPQRYEVTTEQTNLFFHRPYPHAASYFIGIALGYVLANKSIKKLTRLQSYQGWTVCALGLIISLWGSYYWNLGSPYTQLQATVYYHLCQVLWPVSIAWVIFACSIGRGGFVETILSAKCFIPLGRITYMTYLSHALIIYYHSASINIPIEPTMLLFVYIFIANTFLSLLLGTLLTVVYESPILSLQKHLFDYLTKKYNPAPQRETIDQSPRAVIYENNNKNSTTASMLLLSRNKNDLVANGGSIISNATT